MSSPDQQLFSAEEALARLGQNRAQGCLVVSKGAELITIYVKDGYVLSANSSAKTGKDAVEQAVHTADATYQWINGVQAPDQSYNLRLNIQEFILMNGNLFKNKISETGKMIEPGKLKAKGAKAVDEAQYRYFLVPENQPTTKLYLTKSATVLGRNKSSDLVIDNDNISGRHCILDIQSRGLFILDLDSTNGTYINGVFVRDGYVNQGDVLELGSYRLTVNRELRK